MGKRTGRLVGKKGLAVLMSNPQSTEQNDHRRKLLPRQEQGLYIHVSHNQ